MLTQQNLMDEGSQGRIGISAPVIDKIEYQSNRIKNLISHLRMNKRRSSGQVTMTPFNIQNQCQISNIQPISQKLDRNSFQLQLQNEIPIKRNTITMTPIIMKNKSLDKQGIDKGLKYKPRGAVNGRDDIRVRNINQIHKKIIGSLEKKRNQYSPDQKQQQKLQHALYRLEQQDNPQSNNQIFVGNQSKLKLTNSILKKKQSFTQRISNPNKLSDSRHQKFNQNPQKFLIQPKQLLKYLQKINQKQYPTPNCSPCKIYQFFTRLANNFGIENQFNQPLIKRYKNCIYFGHKVSQVGAYMGFVWYFRKALYYGEFQKGRKNGYGIQIDLEQKDNWCLWKGTFLNGKKTGYFQMLSPKLQYNGSLVNSYFEGQGMLKMNNYSIYKGTFHAGMKNGYGVQNFINKKTLCYKGEYSQNKFQGKGQLQGPNYYYKGTFRNSKAHGQGFERTDQFQYQGQFKNGKKSGRGILKLKNGQQYNGIFENGQLIRQTNKNEQKQENAKYINNNMFRNNQYIKSIKIQSANKYKQQSSLLISPILLEQTPIKSPNSQSIESMAKNLHLQLNNSSNNNNSQLRKIKKESPQTSNKNINVSHYSSRIVPLQKHLSKRLKSLYEQNQNQQGTIDQSKKYQINQYENKYQRNNKSNRNQDTNKYNLANLQRQSYNYRTDAHKYKKLEQNNNNQNSDDEQQPLEIKILPKV